VKTPPKKAPADEALELVTGHGVGLVVNVVVVVVFVVLFVVIEVVVVVVVPFVVVEVVVVVPFVVVFVDVAVVPFVVVVVVVIVPFAVVVDGGGGVEVVSFLADAEAKKNKTRSTLIAGMVTTYSSVASGVMKAFLFSLNFYFSFFETRLFYQAFDPFC